MKALQRLAKNLIVLIFWLGVWQALALLVGKPLLLPSPPAVLGRIAQLIVTAEFWRITAVSLGRILLGVVCAMVLGVLLALVTSRWALLRSLFSPLLTVIKVGS